ncbi:hypothetical protein [Lacticaseibacillus absianus]|uniref:hypothetical protein n=1 Tax=Lacticaseibacillus absianus TaxID=2729623 RepID=UPI0015CA89C1|nr:hypothetical protein [Lacticaseibacillus absianus]
MNILVGSAFCLLAGFQIWMAVRSTRHIVSGQVRTTNAFMPLGLWFGLLIGILFLVVGISAFFV